MTFLKGAHYNNLLIYNLITKLKYGGSEKLRFEIAKNLIMGGESVLDICAGTGELSNFLPESCQYTAVEMSPKFTAHLKKNNIKTFNINLHNDEFNLDDEVDTIIMIYSLYQFKETSALKLLDKFKRLARKKVIIIEEILEKKNEAISNENSSLYIAQRIGMVLRDYLCSLDYYKPMSLYEEDAFTKLMSDSGYKITSFSNICTVAVYDKSKQTA
jgi:ubiquinone/menaquinone biosynthesis C-methylase UbiE